LGLLGYPRIVCVLCVGWGGVWGGWGRPAGAVACTACLGGAGWQPKGMGGVQAVGVGGKCVGVVRMGGQCVLYAVWAGEQ